MEIDHSGNNQLFKIDNEQYIIDQDIKPGKLKIRPKHSPFYCDSLKNNILFNDNNASSRFLQENIDFVFVDLEDAAILVTSKKIANAILLLDENISGTIVFTSYQKFGPISQNIEPNSAQTARSVVQIANTIPISFNNILDKPTGYLPTEHIDNLKDYEGLGQSRDHIASVSYAGNIKELINLARIGSKENVRDGNIHMDNRTPIFSSTERGVVMVNNFATAINSVISLGSYGLGIYQNQQCGHITTSYAKEYRDNINSSITPITTTHLPLNTIGTVASTLNYRDTALAANTNMTESLNDLTLRGNASAFNTFIAMTQQDRSITLHSTDYVQRANQTFSETTTASLNQANYAGAQSLQTNTFVYVYIGSNIASAGMTDVIVRVSNLDQASINIQTTPITLTEKSASNYNIRWIDGVFYIYDRHTIYISTDDAVSWNTFNTPLPSTIVNGYSFYGLHNYIICPDKNNNKVYFFLKGSTVSGAPAELGNTVYVSCYDTITKEMTHNTYSCADHRNSSYQRDYHFSVGVKVYKNKTILVHSDTNVTTTGNKLRYKIDPMSANSFIEATLPAGLTNDRIHSSTYMFELNNVLYIVLSQQNLDNTYNSYILSSTDGMNFDYAEFDIGLGQGVLAQSLASANIGSVSGHVVAYLYEDDRYCIVYFVQLNKLIPNTMFISTNKGVSFIKREINIPKFTTNVGSIRVETITANQYGDIFIKRDTASNFNSQTVYVSKDLGETFRELNNISSALSVTSARIDLVASKRFLLCSKSLLDGWTSGNIIMSTFDGKDYNQTPTPSSINSYTMTSSCSVFVETGRNYGSCALNYSSTTNLAYSNRSLGFIMDKNTDYYMVISNLGRVLRRFKRAQNSANDFYMPTKKEVSGLFDFDMGRVFVKTR